MWSMLVVRFKLVLKFSVWKRDEYVMGSVGRGDYFGGEIYKI